MAMEIVGAVASMVQCMCGQSTSEQCSYLKTPQAVVQVLEDKITLLAAREADVRTKLQTENIMRGMDPTAEVTLWLDNVQKIKAKLARLELDIQEHKRFLCGCVPNYYYRLKLGNNVSKMMREADKLLDQSNFPESSLVNLLPKKGKILPTSTLVGETARSILQRTLGYLFSINVGIIGIYGMGGVGKTTIVKEINNMFSRENTHFDDVIWVTASKDSNLLKLQKDIAKAIGLCFDDDEDEDSELMRASALLQALQRRGRFLLIIDDLWEAFSLENIGIPISTNVNGCKLLITTRSLSVCRRMETAVEIEVNVLSAEDAWDLFKQKVGEELVLSSPRIQDLAKQVADECGGVPLALITIGRALRKENNITHWVTALSELRNSAANIEGMDNQVFARLRFSYDRLKDYRTRSCFLYCALYPEDHHIETEELMKYWLWEGLLGIEGNLVVKMQRGRMILNELKNACMLESVYQDGQMDEYVKMHDLIRDMVISIAKANSSFMVKSGRGLRVLPVDNEWSPNLERVSLMRNDLSCLNFEPKCPNLCTLLLQYNSFDKGFQPSFFNHMQNLKVLDLSYTGIDNLPISLFHLENLHVLLLCSCWNLKHVSSVSKLKELRVLDLSYTSISYVPEGMDMLLNLQHLNLSYTNAVEFPLHIFPNYKFLENLFLIGRWQFTLGHLFTDVLPRCTSLSILEVNFSSMQDFHQYVESGHWSLLKSFKFFIGNPPSSTIMRRNSIGFFGVDINEGTNPSVPVQLPDNTLELEIHECPGITHLPVFITVVVSSHLQRCKIRYCDLMDCIFTSTGEWSIFANLEWLEMECLSKLRGICKGIVPEGTFVSLKVLLVSGCNDLTTLLPYELAKNLINLVEISIEKCEKIAEVIEGVEGDEVTQVKFPDIVFPMLQKMKLVDLPQLKHLYNGLMICDNLSSVEVYGCPELKTLPFLVEMREQILCSLIQIKGSKMWWEALRMNHGNAVDLLNPIFKRVEEHSSVQEDSDDHAGSSSFGPR